MRALPVRDDAGTIVQWVGVNVDIHDQRQADESREQFVRLIEKSVDFIAITDEAGTVRYVNQAGRRMLELDAIDDGGARRILDYFVPEERAFVAGEVVESVRRSGSWTGELRLQNFRTGEPIPISSNIFSLLQADGSFAGFATVSRDVRPRYRLEAGLRVLADTGTVMFRSLDFAQTLHNVAEAVTREFATYFIIDFLGIDEQLRRIVSAHGDPVLAHVLERAVAGRRLTDDHHVVRALRDGDSTFVAEIGADWVGRLVEASTAEDVRVLAARSMMCVPLRASVGGRIIGALTFVVDQRDPRGGYTEDDLNFAEEVGLRAGIAFQHAHAYERERRIAVTLQEASLPSSLPDLRHLRLSAEYRPGNSEATIGGDWYDAFPLEDGRVVITIGDVMGNGLGAAVTMGKLRQVMQSVALVSADPRLMLAAADRTVRSISSETYATALVAIYDPSRHEFRISGAGHPAPIMRAADGEIHELRAPGTMLGLWSADQYELITIAAAPGSVLAFFTDGLTEAKRDTDDGYRRLRDAVAALGTEKPVNAARTIVENVLDGETATDDIAVLVATTV